MNRAVAAAVFALFGCFSKPGFNGPVADDAAVDGDGDVMFDAPLDGPPIEANVAFVTSVEVTVGQLGSLGAADAVCANRAAAAGLPPNTYVAWLSSGSTSAASRINPLAQGWVRTDGAPFANMRSGLLGGDLFTPLRIDEMKNDLGSVRVGTATQPSGNPASSDCAGLTGNGETLSYGYSDATRRVWTDASMTSACVTPIRLYCLGTDFTVTVGPAAMPGRIAFVSSPWKPANGLGGADAHCTDLANARSIAGNFIALLATTTGSAASRLEPGDRWVRIDGMPLAPSAVEVMNGALTAPLNVDVMGDYIGDEPVWTGVPFAGTLSSLSTINNTCDNWNGATVFGSTGSPVRTASEWYASATGTGCAESRRLYCFQK